MQEQHVARHVQPHDGRRTPGKASGEQYEGHTFIYSDSTQAITFEGNVNFIRPENNLIQITASALGNGNRKDNSFEIDAFLTIDLKLFNTALEKMSVDILDIVERLGNPVANDLSVESMLKLSNIIGESATRNYEENSLKDYVPLVEASDILAKSLVISGVKLKRDILQ